jgi:hypothetical protein
MLVLTRTKDQTIDINGCGFVLPSSSLPLMSHRTSK